MIIKKLIIVSMIVTESVVINHYPILYGVSNGISFVISAEENMANFQVTAPDSFNFTRPEDWPKWIRTFERYRLASGLNSKLEEMQVNALIYYMGDQADDILLSFGLSADDSKQYNTVKEKFERHFVILRNTIYERAKFNQRK